MGGTLQTTERSPDQLQPQKSSSRNHSFLVAVCSGNIEEMKIQMTLDPHIARSVQDAKDNSEAHIAAYYGLTSVLDHQITREPELLWD